MKLKVYPTEFHGTVSLIGSKSLSHRTLIVAACAEGLSILEGLMESDDIRATTDALKALGATVEGSRVEGPLNRAPQTIEAGASGSTLRMMIPQALRMNEPITFTGKQRLPYRSLAAYEGVFAGSVRFEHPQETWLPLTVQGPLHSGTYRLDPTASSQFVSGLLMALPLCEGDSRIEFTEPLVSKPYVMMTLSVLEAFGVTWTEEANGYSFKAPQKLTPRRYTVEGDFSQSLFFLAGGLLGGHLTLHNLPQTSVQGDFEVIEWLNHAGGHIVYEQNGWKVRTHALEALRVDLTDHPDTAPMLMALAGLTPGRHRFKGVSRLIDKESDRLAALQETLASWGVPTQQENDTFWIEGKGSFTALEPLKTYEDHRLAMSYLMCAPKACTPYIVEGVECIAKSYPNFLEVYRSIGGRFDVLEGDTV